MQHGYHPCIVVHMLLALANAALLLLSCNAVTIIAMLVWLPVAVAIIITIVITPQNQVYIYYCCF